MVKACVLITCKAGAFQDIIAKIKKIKGVKKTFPVLGRWDIIAELEAENIESLGKLVLEVNSIEGVKATETLVGF